MVKSERNPQCDETVILRVLLWCLKRETYFFLVSVLPVNLKF